MASITSVSASPPSIGPGGSSKIVPVTSNPDRIATVTVSVDGSQGSAQVSLHEPLTFSVNPADLGKPGLVVATVDKGGTLAVGPDGASFVLTSP